jgi:hypothetical protein
MNENIIDQALQMVGSEKNNEVIPDWDAYIIQRENRKIEEQRKERWNKICPILYRETDENKIKKERLDFVLSWNPHEGKNLWLNGESGTQKTRMAYLLLKQKLFMGYSVESINAVELGIKMSMPAWDGREREIDRLSKYSILLIDDLGKEPNTQMVVSGFSLLIEKRYANKKLNIITSNNQTRAETKSDLVYSTYRRLREICIFVEVSK